MKFKGNELPASLRDTLIDLLAQIERLQSSPNEKNNIKLYGEISTIFDLLFDILDNVLTHQEGDIKTGNDLIQGIVDLQQNVKHLESTSLIEKEMMKQEFDKLKKEYEHAQDKRQSEYLVETEMMKDRHDKLKQKYDDAQQNLERDEKETPQKDSKNESLMTEIKRLSHQLLSKEDEIKRLIGNHEQILENNKKDMQVLVKENKGTIIKHEATISNLLNKHKEDISTHEKKMKDYDTQLTKRENIITQQAEMLHKYSVQLEKFEVKPSKERSTKPRMSIKQKTVKE